MKYPHLPANLTIGNQILTRMGGAHFKGDVRRDEDLVEEIYPGPAEIALHKQGIKIWNTFYQKQIEIHNSQVINLEIITQDESFPTNRSSTGNIFFAILAVITLGVLFDFPVGSNSSNSGYPDRLVYVSYLVLHFWDTNTKMSKTISISGNKRKINRFIARYGDQNSIL